MLLLDSVNADEKLRASFSLYFDFNMVKRNQANNHHKTSYLADVLLAVRFRAGLSQAEFANSLGIRQSTISCWESGKKRPSTSVLELMVLHNFISRDEYVYLDSCPLMHATLCDSIWAFSDPYEALSSLNFDSSGSEEIDILRLRSLFLVFQSRSRVNPNWTLATNILADRLSGELMAQYRNSELMHFSALQATNQKAQASLGEPGENLIVMNAISALRSTQNERILKKHYTELGSRWMQFEHSRSWAGVTFAQLAFRLGFHGVALEAFGALSAESSSKPHLRDADSLLHLVSELSCNVGEARMGIHLLEKHWEAYWDHVDATVPYVYSIYVVAARCFRLLGDYRNARNMLEQVTDRISTRNFHNGSLAAKALLRKIDSEQRQLD